MVTIVDAIEDPALLGAAIKDRSTFTAWRVTLKALFGLSMTDAEADVFRACTGRSDLPTAPFGILWLVCGRRGGKSFVMALVAVYMGIFKDWRRFLSPGERAVVLLVAADREQAKVIRRYVGGILENPMFKPRVEGETADSIEIAGDVVIEVATCSYRTVRGRSVCVALLDEVAFWRSESTANPDREVWRGIRGSMASFGSDSVAIIGSSPYARKGILWDGHRRYFGKPDARNIVWQAGTKMMNPTISDEFLREEFEADPVAAEAEYNALFRSDIESFAPREVIEAAIMPDRHELPPISDTKYFAFVDPSGGSADAMTLAVSHKDNQNKAILDAVRVRKPPFSPEAVVTDFVAVLKSYGVNKVVGDRYGGEFCREPFRKAGIAYDLSDRPKSDIYRDALPLLNSGKVELLDLPRLTAELCGLERRTARSGKDSIDHAPGGHDDLANAVCGALTGVLPARINEAPVAQFGHYTTHSPVDPGNPYVGTMQGGSGRRGYSSYPPEELAARGIFHPNDREYWIKKGVWKPPQATKDAP